MAIKQKPVLVVMMGHIGSGKSYFARQLAETKKWVRLNGDSFRMAWLGSVEAIQAADLELKREGVFRGLDYAAQQILISGQSVVYDSNNNKRVTRKTKEKIAQEASALPVLVWVKTTEEEALMRIQTREPAVDQRKFDEPYAREVMERHIAATDEPAVDENVIEIDGTAPFKEQLAVFENGLQKYL